MARMEDGAVTEYDQKGRIVKEYFEGFEDTTLTYGDEEGNRTEIRTVEGDEIVAQTLYGPFPGQADVHRITRSFSEGEVLDQETEWTEDYRKLTISYFSGSADPDCVAVFEYIYSRTVVPVLRLARLPMLKG